MRLVPADKNQLGHIMYKKTENQLLLEEFAKSDCECMEVVGFLHKSSSTCAAALNGSIKIYGHSDMKAIERKGKVYLIKGVIPK